MQPGSAHASEEGTKSNHIPMKSMKQLWKDQKEFAALGEREDFESRVNKQLMSLCFVFELDKIRKKPHEFPNCAHELMIFIDQHPNLVLS